MFFSSTYGTLFRLEYILGHKISLIEFQNIEIIKSIFYVYKLMKLEIKNRKLEVTNMGILKKDTLK